MKNKLIGLTMFVLMLLAGCSNQQPSNMADIEAHMKALYAENVALLETPEERQNVTLIDFGSGYMYSETAGLKPFKVYQPDANGVVALPNGQSLRLPKEDFGSSGLQPLAQYEPYRRVKSTTGMSRIDGYITLPRLGTDITGVDNTSFGTEAAYNYVGLEGSGWITEVGLFRTAWRSGGWGIFHRFTPGVVWTEDTSWNGIGTPIPDGNRVYVKAYVSANGNLNAYYSYGTKSRTFTYTGLSTNLNGSGQTALRVTALLVDNPGGRSSNNKWDNIYVGNSSTNRALLTTTNTSGVTSFPNTTQVSAIETNKYYNETVNIKVP
jgi:hypothetical protein